MKHYNASKAQSEGWVLSERDDGLYQIQRFDSDPMERFDSDFAAYVFVRAQASPGCPMHSEAIVLHGTPVPAA